MAYPGVGVKHKMTDAAKQSRLRWSTFDPSAANVIGPVDVNNPAASPTVQYYDFPNDMGCVSSAAYLDVAQDVGLTWWTTGAEGEWEDIEDPEYGGNIVYQRDGTADTTYTASSQFQLPPFPVITMALWRGDVAEEQTETPYTEIQFGPSEGYALSIPYDSPPYMSFWNTNIDEWEAMEPVKGSSLSSVGATGKGNRIWITIISNDNHIFARFSSGGNADGSWAAWELPQVEIVRRGFEYLFDPTYKPTTRVDASYIGEGPLKIAHNGSPFAFRWFPIYHCPQATEDTQVAYSTPVDAGYNIWSAKIETGYADIDNGAPWGAEWGPTYADYSIRADTCYSFGTRVWKGRFPQIVDDANTNIKLTPVDPDNIAATSTRFTWVASWYPAHWMLNSTGAHFTGTTNAAGGYTGIHHWSAPYLFATLCTAPPAVMAHATGGVADWPTATDVTGEVQAISVRIAEGNSIGQAGIELRNKAGVFSTAKDGQIVAVQMGYSWSDGSDDISIGDSLIFAGYVVTPGQNAKVGPIEKADFVLYDPLIRMRDEKAYGLEPDFQFWSPKGAIEWLGARCGIPYAQMDLSGTDVVMRLGTPGYDDDWNNGTQDHRTDSLIPAFGAELLDACMEYARRDNESLLFAKVDGTMDDDDNFNMLWKLYKSDGEPGPTDGTLFTVYEDATGAQYRLFDLNVQSIPMDPEHYADTIVVRGRDIAGGIVQAAASTITRVYDATDANYTGGWHKMYLETRDSLQTEADCRARAIALLNKKSRKPKILTLTTDVLAGINKGDRIKISRNSGSDGKAYNAGVLDVEFRVETISYDYSGPNQWPKCTISGRNVL